MSKKHKQIVMDLWRIKDVCRDLYDSKGIINSNKDRIIQIISYTNKAIRECVACFENPIEGKLIIDELDYQENFGRKGKRLVPEQDEV